MTGNAPLRIGMIGSGFMARFHLQAMVGVRDAVIAGVFSPDQERRAEFCRRVDAAGVGPCRSFPSVEELAGSDEIDAVWVVGPNDRRVAHMRAIIAAAGARRRPLLGVACEKPLGRTLAEARELVRLAEQSGLRHGYLENQIFAPSVRRGKEIIWRRAAAASGRPYLARASEEHSGPHAPWFWQAGRQGGGVLLDMLCHSYEVARFLLTEPGRPRTSLRLESASGTVASLKWTQPRYASALRTAMGDAVDYATRPAEDFARGTLTLRDHDGALLVVEASTSWAYVGPGLRIQIELLGPEYAMEISTLSTGLKVFLSREVTGQAGEDLVEKQNAEQGLMPVVEDEATLYGYVAENRHMVHAFLTGQPPEETFHDGAAVLEALMALYLSAETGRTVTLPDESLASFVPAVARAEPHSGR
ncbi:MAG TPA: Gfo/Idh/MocA family oxidoreductase [Streptosporangiaceae bacterium]|nr:Gfo/Idh/MocA family oxidoreductase [Streptosporangiaceae bacterium]